MTSLAAPSPDHFGLLIARFAAGDVAAFHEFYRLLLPAARAVARRVLHDSHLVDDAVQDAGIKAWKAASRFVPGDGRAWFLCIVRNTALNTLAKRARSDVLDPADLAAEAGRVQERSARDGGVAMSLDEASFLQAVAREPWFCRLARREQQIVVLRFMGFGNGEIMRRLPNVTHNEIIRRALARAARNLRKDGGKGTIAQLAC